MRGFFLLFILYKIHKACKLVNEDNFKVAACIFTALPPFKGFKSIIKSLRGGFTAIKAG
jgi:hypothetical protein